MEPFHLIFPDAPDPINTLELKKKTGTVPKGTYGFIECYCTDPHCDCRRAMVLVLNDKMKQKAAIFFGFDQESPMDGPFLEPAAANAPYAQELLEFFVDSLNSRPEWLERMYRQYRAVREMADGKRYRGKAFPKPGKLLYRTLPPPDLEALMEQSLQELIASGRPAAAPKPGKRGKKALPGSEPAGRRSARSAEKGMALLVRRYAELGNCRSLVDDAALQDELWQYLQANDQAGEE